MILSAFIISILVAALMEFCWLTYFIGPMYLKYLSNIMLLNSAGQFAPNLLAVCLIYAVMIFALWYFVIWPYKNHDILQIMREGFIFGACFYAAYALTCWSLFINFNAYVVLADIMWGGILFAVSAGITCKFMQMFV